jgi:hypothetical protein
LAASSGGDQVAARREKLADLDPRRSEPLEGVSHPDRLGEVLLGSAGRDSVFGNVVAEVGAPGEMHQVLVAQHVQDLLHAVTALLTRRFVLGVLGRARGRGGLGGRSGLGRRCGIVRIVHVDHLLDESVSLR